MVHHLTCRRYRLPMHRPVQTAHGAWPVREGVLVRLESEAGPPGYGEAAPVPRPGGGTVAEVEDALAELGGRPAVAALARAASRENCLGFALASARGFDREGAPAASRLPVAALLPAGRPAFAAADRAREQGYVACKWKVAVGTVADELAMFDDLLGRLAAGAKLRLDANGGWSTKQAGQWLDRCAGRPVEFVEQPCFADVPPASEARRRADDALRGLARDYPTPIALDESVTGLASLRAWLDGGWPGVVVVKPALAGPPGALLDLLQSHRADAVFSSALETAVGRRAALETAFRYRGPVPRALGFGVTPLFGDPRLDGPETAPFMTIDDVSRLNPEAAWNALS